jgi:hypothetical protein
MQNQRRRYAAIDSKSISKSVKIHAQNTEGRNVKTDQKVVVEKYSSSENRGSDVRSPEKIDQKSIHGSVCVCCKLEVDLEAPRILVYVCISW